VEFPGCVLERASSEEHAQDGTIPDAANRADKRVLSYVCLNARTYPRPALPVAVHAATPTARCSPRRDDQVTAEFFEYVYDH